nr:hypothetical protein [uncultured Holophaga sp.]
MTRHPIFPLLVAGLVVQAAPAPVIRHLGSVQATRSGLEVVRGEITLPTTLPGPALRLAPGETGLSQVYLLPPELVVTSPWKRQMAREKRREAVEEVWQRLRMSPLQGALERYASRHGGKAPDRLEEPAWLQAIAQGANEHAGLPPYAPGSPEAESLEQVKTALTGFSLLPGVPWEGADQAAAQGVPLFLETSPAVDDGLHWVVDNGLQARREPIRSSLLASHHLKLSLERVIPIPTDPDPGLPMAWTIVGLRRHQATSAHLELIDGQGGVRPLIWTFPPQALPDPTPDQTLHQWAFVRAQTWRQGSGEASPLVGHWLRALPRVFGTHEGFPWPEESWYPDARGQRETGEPSLLSLLGGRAAVDETLQTDRPLEDAGSSAPTKPLSLEQIPGITVEPYPFEAMLGRRPVATPPLADCVPTDRAMLYLPNPREALRELAQGGGRILEKVGGLLHQGVLDHDLITRAQGDLGLGSPLGKRLLEAGAVESVVAFAPDLALLSGSDWTVVAELRPSVASLAALMLEGTGVHQVATPRGQAHWALRGRRLFMSTSPRELQLALDLEAHQGAGSLGRSAEFRYLQLKLAPDPQTLAYVCLPDAFLRRVVGPELRILQLRQGRERQRLEELAAAVQLRRLDTGLLSRDPGELKSRGYLREDFDMGGLLIDERGTPVSETWGALDHLKPLSQVGLGPVTSAEAEAYASFRDRYSSYWQRYFDPMVFRLDGGEGHERNLETFILPLIDTSIYRVLGKLAPPRETPLPVPIWTRPMVAELSLSLPTAEALKGFRLPKAMTLSDPYLFDLLEQLGTQIHIAFPDAAPILQMGGGAPSGLFSQGPLTGRNRWMMFAPLLLGPLTRPMVVAVELKDPIRAQTALDRMVHVPLTPPGDSDWFRIQLARDEQGRLILSSTVLGMLTQRFSLRVEDRWLVLANDTTLPCPLVQGTGARPPASATLELRPDHLKLGLAAAFQSYVEGEAYRRWSAQRWLAPWLSGGATVAEAQTACRALLGAAPELPGDALLPGGRLDHPLRDFGSPAAPLLPRLPEGDFGVLEGIRAFRVEMGFEASGLRTRISWR